jgi:hypothetical protein
MAILMPRKCPTRYSQHIQELSKLLNNIDLLRNDDSDPLPNPHRLAATSDAYIPVERFYHYLPNAWKRRVCQPSPAAEWC